MDTQTNRHGRALRILLFTACASAFAFACTPERERRGDINLIYGVTGQTRVLFGVEAGRIVAQNLDIATETPEANSCVRGTWGRSAISLCPKPLDEDDSHYGGKIVRWMGPNGDLAIEVAPNGAAVRIDGRLTRSSGSGLQAADASVHGVPSGERRGGGGAGGFTFDGERGGSRDALNPQQQTWMHITLPLGQGAEWDEMRKTPVLYALAAASVGLTSGEAVRPELMPAKERKDALAPKNGTPIDAEPAPVAN